MAKIFGKFSKACRRNKNLLQPHTLDKSTLGVSVLESQGSFSPTYLNAHKLPFLLGWWAPHFLFALIKREHGTKQNKFKNKKGK